MTTPRTETAAPDGALHAAFRAALDRAQEHVGATSPNPPVGAAAIDSDGRLLSVQAHERAGTGHAEAKVLADLAARGLTDRIHTLVITLEPCNHQGRTPPCTEAILAALVPRVVYGVPDPNPRVAGKGAERLRQAGVEVSECPDPALHAECERLLRPFSHWARTGFPWIVVKRAVTREGSMIPPPGSKTFTSQESLRLAHRLRRRADAILTGSGTVIADRPELTVRLIPDHALVSAGAKRRWLVVLDRRGRVPEDWVRAAENRGFQVMVRQAVEPALLELGRLGALEVLVEAGPALSAALLSSGLWNEDVLITQGDAPGAPDTVRIEENVHWHRSESRDGNSG